MTMIEQVAKFHQMFNLPILVKPTIPDNDRVYLRKRLIIEEFTELMEALDNNDLREIAKEAADLHYVISGMCLEYGIPEDKVFKEVHTSNMSKVWDDGTVHYNEDGKVLKPPTYKKPDLMMIPEGDYR